MLESEIKISGPSISYPSVTVEVSTDNAKGGLSDEISGPSISYPSVTVEVSTENATVGLQEEVSGPSISYPSITVTVGTDSAKVGRQEEVAADCMLGINPDGLKLKARISRRGSCRSFAFCSPAEGDD